MISVIRQLHNGIRACVRRDDRVCSGWLSVGQGLCQGCVFAPLMLNIFFAAFKNVENTRFKAGKDTMDTLMNAKKKGGAEGSNRRRTSLVDAALGRALR